MVARLYSPAIVPALAEVKAQKTIRMLESSIKGYKSEPERKVHGDEQLIEIYCFVPRACEARCRDLVTIELVHSQVKQLAPRLLSNADLAFHYVSSWPWLEVDRSPGMHLGRIAFKKKTVLREA